MGLLEELREALGIVIRAVLDRDRKVAPHNQASVAVLLEEKETSRPLYIGECFRRRFLEEIEPPAARNGEAEIAHEFLIMLLADAEEVENVFIQIIEDSHSRSLFVKEHVRPAAEGLDIAGVPGDQ